MAQALILIAIVPTGINTVIVATLLDAQPDTAATTVMLSTLFALFFVPFMVMIFLT
jgi:malate permease and related proteins